jgi:hypothetical protein
MADIDVVPKRRTATWVWLIVALLVIVALWFMFAGGSSAPSVGDRGLDSLGTFAVAVAPALVH